MNPGNAGLSNKILVIDDNQLFRAALGEMLMDFGYSVIHAENGLDGLRKLKANPDSDLAIVDLMMPIMDGFTFITEARKEHPDLPIVAISGVGTIEKALEAINIGAWDFINKPIESHKLIKLVIERNINRYLTYKSNQEYKNFLENLAKMRSTQLEEALSREQHTEEAYLHYISLYKNAFMMTPFPIVLADLGTRSIVDANMAFLQVAELPGQELPGQSLADVFVCTTLDGTVLHFSESLPPGTIGNYPVTCTINNGKSLRASLEVIPFFNDEKEQLVMLVFDTTKYPTENTGRRR